MATTSGSPFPSSDEALMGDDVSLSRASRSSMASSATGSTPASGNEILDRVVSGAHNAIDRLAETVAPHVQRMQDGVSHANQSLHQRSDDMRDLSDEWADSLRTTVRENPLAAVAAAVAVGILVAKLSS